MYIASLHVDVFPNGTEYCLLFFCDRSVTAIYVTVFQSPNRKSWLYTNIFSNLID
jgi:hypothetical protein